MRRGASMGSAMVFIFITMQLAAGTSLRPYHHIINQSASELTESRIHEVEIKELNRLSERSSEPSQNRTGLLGPDSSIARSGRRRRRLQGGGASRGAFKAIAGVVGIAVSTTVVLTSFTGLYAAFLMDNKELSVVCIIAQSFYKLLAVPYMNFTLANSTFSELYYGTFNLFYSPWNEYFAQLIIGKSNFNLNQETMSVKRLSLVSSNGLMDNFIFNNFVELLALATTVAICASVSYLFRKRIKSIIPRDKFLRRVFAMIFIQHDIKTISLLLLNCLIPSYASIVLTIFKALGYVLALIYLVVYLATIGVHKTVEGSSPSIIWKLAMKLADTLTEVLSACAKKEYATGFFRVYLAHNLLFSICLVLFSYIGYFQILAWIVAEIVQLVLLSCYKIFKSNYLLWFQLANHFLFIALLGAIALNVTSLQSNELSGVIFIISILLLLKQLGLMLFCIVWSIKERLKDHSETLSAELTKSSPPQTSSHSQDPSQMIQKVQDLEPPNSNSRSSGNKIRPIQMRTSKPQLQVPRDDRQIIGDSGSRLPANSNRNGIMKIKVVSDLVDYKNPPEIGGTNLRSEIPINGSQDAKALKHSIFHRSSSSSRWKLAHVAGK